MKRAILWGGAAGAVLIAGGATFFIYLRMTTAPRPAWDEEVAAYLAIVEEGQPSAEEAENGWPLVEELARRAEAEDAAVQANLRAFAATIPHPAFDPNEFIGDWIYRRGGFPAELQAKVDEEIKRLEREGFFAIAEQIARAERFVWTPDRTSSYFTSLPSVPSGVRRAQGLLRHREEIALRNGDADGFLAAFGQRAALGQAVASRMTRIDVIVACSVHTLLATDARETGLRRQASRPLLRPMLGVLSHRALDLKSERWLRAAQIADRITLVFDMTAPAPGPAPSMKERLLWSCGIDPVLRVQYQIDSEWDRVISASKLSRIERRAAGIGPRHADDWGVLRSLDSRDRYFAILQGTRLLLAVECFRDDYGVPPPDFDALVPEYLNEVPTDPYAPDGKFVYRLIDPATDAHGRDYLLYSVGFDGKDDGGTPASWPEQAFNHDTPGTDAVFNESEHKP